MGNSYHNRCVEVRRQIILFLGTKPRLEGWVQIPVPTLTSLAPLNGCSALPTGLSFTIHALLSFLFTGSPSGQGSIPRLKTIAKMVTLLT